MDAVSALGPPDVFINKFTIIKLNQSSEIHTAGIFLASGNGPVPWVVKGGYVAMYSSFFFFFFWMSFCFSLEIYIYFCSKPQSTPSLAPLQIKGLCIFFWTLKIVWNQASGSYEDERGREFLLKTCSSLTKTQGETSKLLRCFCRAVSFLGHLSLWVLHTFVCTRYLWCSSLPALSGPKALPPVLRSALKAPSFRPPRKPAISLG